MANTQYKEELLWAFLAYQVILNGLNSTDSRSVMDAFEHMTGLELSKTGNLVRVLCMSDDKNSDEPPKYNNNKTEYKNFDKDALNIVEMIPQLKEHQVCHQYIQDLLPRM